MEEGDEGRWRKVMAVDMEVMAEGGAGYGGEHASLRLICTKMAIHVAYGVATCAWKLYGHLGACALAPGSVCVNMERGGICTARCRVGVHAYVSAYRMHCCRLQGTLKW